ncbi:MAG TPA: saccharopine dehydrogenase NADP-binding domain-containing protein [Kofleriaceae bacterium]|nr:saccharopine dehydrogenase NADP-binding domain-containing protein [Kofleriaceae bacterium]
MIVIYGAAGTTGTLVARELFGRGHRVVLSGRDRSRLERLASSLAGHRPGVADAAEPGGRPETRPAQVHDAAEMAAAMRGARVVVACAGPFLQVGEAALRAALEAGAHYIDVCGEQAFLREAYERFDSPARRAGVTAVPGFAWEIALGDWAASRAAALCRAQVAPAGRAADGGERGEPAAGALAPVDEIAIGYALSQVSTTPGTRQSLVAALSQPISVWLEDRWERVAPLSRTRSIAFPPPFGEREALLWPSGEVITVPRHAPARRVEAYLSAGGGAPALRAAARLAGLVGPLVSVAAASPLGAFVRARAGAGPPPDEAARRSIEFAIVAEASLHFRRARVSLGGTDPYAQSARIAALGVERLLGAGPPFPAGVIAPSQLVSPEGSLAALVGEGWLSLAEN